MDDMNMKNDCLNVCKGIAAFFIVFIHCNFPSPVGGMMNGLARFGVPLFFMVSGYFSYGKGMDTVKKRDDQGPFSVTGRFGGLGAF